MRLQGPGRPVGGPAGPLLGPDRPCGDLLPSLTLRFANPQTHTQHPAAHTTRPFKVGRKKRERLPKLTSKSWRAGCGWDEGARARGQNQSYNIWDNRLTWAGLYAIHGICGRCTYLCCNYMDGGIRSRQRGLQACAIYPMNSINP